MSTNLTDVVFAETGQSVVIDFISGIDGFTGAEAEALQLLPGGAHFTWLHVSGETTTRKTWFVPYSNIKAIKQDEVLP